jgi:hypothetical protein
MAEPSISTPLGRAPVIPLAILGAGLYLAWFGVHYWGSDTRWPSDPVKAVLTGKSLPVPAGQLNAAAVAAAVEAPASSGGGSGAGGGSYTKTSLQGLWTSNGGSPGTAGIASAIALAESAGQSQVTSANPDGGTNVGLWQLDTRGKGAGYTVAQLQDPVTNARVAIMGSVNGTNWSAWETYANGAYKQFL